ncbi:unnamed protein product [Amoebophrya sp. A25]|nr:unnamed protein product [Amoebophrya sp. A25]|eukprot:GSA25T00024046001.1
MRGELVKKIENSTTSVQELKLSLLRIPRQGGGGLHQEHDEAAARPLTTSSSSTTEQVISSTSSKNGVASSTITEARAQDIELTLEQQHAVHTEGPLLLHGQSGTAKTTLLQHRALEHEDKQKGLALFTSMSPFLVRSIENSYKRLGGTALAKEGRGGQLVTSLCELQTSASRGALFLSFDEFLRLLDQSTPVGRRFYGDTAFQWCHVGDRLGKTLSGGKARQPVGHGSEVTFQRHGKNPFPEPLRPRRPTGLFWKTGGNVSWIFWQERTRREPQLVLRRNNLKRLLQNNGSSRANASPPENEC